jgi:hypothetical protein
MFRSAVCFAAALGLYAAGTAGCLAATAAIAKHLEHRGCVVEAVLANLDPSYCEHR